MQKNSGEIFTSIEVDTVTGEYYTVIPEAVVNDLGWFEETPLKWSIDGKEASITEQNYLDKCYIMEYDSNVTYYSYG